METEIFRTVKGLSNELGKVRSNNEDLSTENQELRKEKLKAREQLIKAENRLKARTNELFRLKLESQTKKTMHEVKVWE